MKVGVVFPQTEYGNDPADIRDYARTAEALGYNHILAYDHVLGANRDRHTGLKGPYSHNDAFHEPFVLFAYMAAFTKNIEFTSGIIILPQRQTALVAKQAATLDVLSGGRYRMGVGIGCNYVEYKALGQDFHTRGRRVEEQVQLLRQLWNEPLVNFEGQWDSIPDAGLKPLPLQRPIPIWFGGRADRVLRRIAQFGDGWMPTQRTAAEAQPSLDKLTTYLAEAGRSWDDIGLEPRIWYGDGNPNKWESKVQEWMAAGATHLTLDTMRCGFQNPHDHLKAIDKFSDDVAKWLL